MTRAAALESLALAATSYGMTPSGLYLMAAAHAERGEVASEGWCQAMADALRALAEAEP